MEPVTSIRARAVVRAGSDALRLVIDSGMLRLGVPAVYGGAGGDLSTLVQAARRLAQRDPAAAWVFRAQRTAIELLLRADNVGLREHVLPQLLAGDRAGTLPLGPEPMPLLAVEAGSACRLYGRYTRVPNLQWIGFSIIAPVRLSHSVEWILVRGEEAGLGVGIDDGAPCPQGSRTATVTFDDVFFRMDEWLGDAALWGRCAPVADALADAVPIPAA